MLSNLPLSHHYPWRWSLKYHLLSLDDAVAVPRYSSGSNGKPSPGDNASRPIRHTSQRLWKMYPRTSTTHTTKPLTRHRLTIPVPSLPPRTRRRSPASIPPHALRAPKTAARSLLRVCRVGCSRVRNGGGRDRPRRPRGNRNWC